MTDQILDQAAIAAEFPDLVVSYHASIDSTNQHLLGLGSGAQGVLCIAETQTAGRGRRGRQWISPVGRSLSISLGWPTRRSLGELGGLSLVAGVAIVQTLHRAGAEEVGLKWPNDVLARGAKICGILTELINTPDTRTAVIGFGVNVQLTDQEIADVEQPVIDLSRLGVAVDRTTLTIDLVRNLKEALQRFEQHGFADFIPQYAELHLYHDQEVNIHQGSTLISGRVAGIDEDGALILQGAAGEQRFLAGEVSLRGHPG